MAQLDFIECTSKAYSFVWARRVDILALSAMVLTLKILFFIGFVVFDYQDEVLRQGLWLLPTYLLEGWVIAQIVMMALYSEQPTMPGKIAYLPPPEDIEANVKGGMIAYALTKLMLSFVVGYTYRGQMEFSQMPTQGPSAQALIIAMLIMVFLIWAFRFLWLYIPIIMGKSIFDYLQRVQGFSPSFFLLGVWILCFVPMLVLLVVLSQVLSLLFVPTGDEGAVNLIYKSGLASIQALIDYALALLSSLGVAFGIAGLYKDEKAR